MAKKQESIERLNRFKTIKVLYTKTFAMTTEQLKIIQEDIETVLSMLKEKDKEIEKKDKMIDLMLESIELQQYANIDTTDLDLICKDIKCNKKCTIIKKECIYKHFERKANNERN